MDIMDKYLISKDSGKLQIPYSEYESLMEKLQEAQRIRSVKEEVLDQLQRYLKGKPSGETIVEAKPAQPKEPAVKPDRSGQVKEPEKVSVEFSPEDQHDGKSSQATAASSEVKASVETPPIKKDVEEHFNSHDPSGRLLNVFKQYYTCLNESCRGIVRVTLKDGICSLWNYDKWEEFAFVDIHQNQLRITLDPRYTDDLSALDFCEVARLLSTRREFIAIAVEGLNKTMLHVLTRAFEEVGLTAG